MRCIVVDGKRYEIAETEVSPRICGVDEKGTEFIRYNPKLKMPVATERK